MATLAYDVAVMEKLKTEFETMKDAMTTFNNQIDNFRSSVFVGGTWEGETATKFDSATDELLEEAKAQMKQIEALIASVDTTKKDMNDAEQQANAYVNR